jgi:hypothetical protein
LDLGRRGERLSIGELISAANVVSIVEQSKYFSTKLITHGDSGSMWAVLVV